MATVLVSTSVGTCTEWISTVAMASLLVSLLLLEPDV